MLSLSNVKLLTVCRIAGESYFPGLQIWVPNNLKLLWQVQKMGLGFSIFLTEQMPPSVVLAGMKKLILVTSFDRLGNKKRIQNKILN